MRIVVALSAIIVSACGAGQQQCSTNGFIYRDLRCEAPLPDGRCAVLPDARVVQRRGLRL